jgi:hypothetical protein
MARRQHARQNWNTNTSYKSLEQVLQCSYIKEWAEINKYILHMQMKLKKFDTHLILITIQLKIFLYTKIKTQSN